MIERLIDRLQQAGLTLTYEEIADALWLAERIDAPATPDLAAQPKRDDDPSRVTLGPIEPGPQDTAPQDIDGMPLFAADAIGTTPDEAGEAETAEPAGLPLSVPAASALPNAIDLSRALRDLMRKVPSQTRFELDEAATVDQIAIQRVRYPVVKPELERWLDLELVIEESDTSFIWRKTVEAFRKKVLEKLGAFRTLRTWRLQADDRGQLQLWPYLPDKIPTPGQPHQALKPRSPKALQASERRLIVLVSDCRSSLWQQRPQARRANAKEKPTWVLYDWLQQWAAKGPTAVLQVLPERLWEKTELGYGDPVQFSARLPGVTNTHLVTDEMTAWVSDEPAPHRARPLPLPVITLDAKPLKRWAQVVAGVGNTRTPGYWFDVGLLHQYPSDSDEDSASRSVEARVNRFFASASPTAQSLARLMAAAPVSLSVVYLIRETMLPQAKPVHIAEVFISDLLHPTGRSTATGEPIYDFYTGVRERIVQLSDPDLTLQVFARLTDKIGEEIGDAINSFDALLAPKPEWLTASDAVAPFAAVTSQVLRVLGGDYAALLETVEQEQRIQQIWQQQQTVAALATTAPPLQTLEFVTAQIVDPLLAPTGITLQQEAVVVAEITLEPLDDGLETFEFVTGQLEKREREGNLLTRLLPGRRQTEWVVRRQRRQARQLVEELPGGVTLEMVAIPSGIFMMGSPEDEVDRSTREGAQHEVSVFPFLLGKYPVTQAQWRAVAGLPPVEIELTPDPSSFKGDNRPVESVNWHEAVEFCARLSAHTNRQYGLPSEAQWEYACRAGTTTPFHFGETITTNLANYNGTDRLGYDSSGSYGTGPKGESREKTTPVVLFEIANRFGLWDMHGNVWEWCADHWHNGYTGAPIDGTAWLNDEEEQAKQHVLRGGSWFNPPSGCCSTSRLNFSSGTRNFGLGFRASCILKTGSA